MSNPQLPPGFKLDDQDAKQIEMVQTAPGNYGLPAGFKIDEQEAPRERGRAALNGFTFGLGPRIMAAGRYAMGEGWEDAKKKEYDALEGYRKARPWEAIGYEVAGSLPTMLIPGVGAVGNANRVRLATQAATPAARVAAGVGSVGAEIARGGAQMGALNAALHSKDYTDVADVAQNSAVGGAVGYGVGRVVNGVAQPIVNAVRNLHEAAAVGSNATGAALRQTRQSIAEQGTDLAQAARSIFPAPRPNVTPEGQQAAVVAYHNAIAGGSDHATASRAAEAAYAALNPTYQGRQLAQTGIASHVADAVQDYATHNRVPLLAAEIFSGADRPIQGEMKSLTTGLMNSSGEARTILDNVTRNRVEGAIPRTRQLIDNTIGANLPGNGRDFVTAVRNIEQASNQARGIAFNRARANARPFELDTAPPGRNSIFDRAQNRLNVMSGDPERHLTAALDDMRAWAQKVRDQNMSPADQLNSYIQARSALNQSIGEHQANGRNTSAAALLDLKREMDIIVRRRNPDWAHANDGAAETFGVRKAADLGRSLPLNEGAETQIAKFRMQGGNWGPKEGPLSLPERETLRLGYARMLQDQLSKKGDDHQVANIFRRGNDANEGTRGMITPMLETARQDAADMARAAAAARGTGRSNQAAQARAARESIPTSDRFFHDIERENISHATYGLNKNSVTSAVQDADKKRNALIRAAASIRNNPNPLDWVAKGAEMVADRMGRGRDTEMARILGTTTDNPAQLLRYIEQLQRTAPGMRDGFYNATQEQLARISPFIAAKAGERMTDPPPKQRFARPTKGRGGYSIGAGR